MQISACKYFNGFDEDRTTPIFFITYKQNLTKPLRTEFIWTLVKSNISNFPLYVIR